MALLIRPTVIGMKAGAITMLNMLSMKHLTEMPVVLSGKLEWQTWNTAMLCEILSNGLHLVCRIDRFSCLSLL